MRVLVADCRNMAKQRPSRGVAGRAGRRRTVGCDVWGMRSYREGGATFSTGNYQMESRHAAVIVTATLHDKSRSARREQALSAAYRACQISVRHLCGVLD